MAASVGMLGQFGIGASGAPSTPSTVRLDYQSENIVMNEDFINANGLKGSLSHSIDRVRAGLQRIAGPVMFQPNAVELAAILQWIFGGTPTGTPTVTYPVSDTAYLRDVMIDRKAKVFSLTDVGVDVATFRAGQGEPLSVELQCIARSEAVGNSGTFPSLSLDTANGPFILSDLVMTIAGTTVKAKEFEVVVNNMIDKDRFFNSNTLTTIEKLDREVTFRTSLPYGDHAALYNSGAGGVAVVATFTNSSAVLAISLVKVALPRQSPGTPGRVEIMLPLAGRAYKSGSTAEIVTTLNPGP